MRKSGFFKYSFNPGNLTLEVLQQAVTSSTLGPVVNLSSGASNLTINFNHNYSL